jgi:hypothetical protein
MGTPLAAEHDDFTAWKQMVEAKLRQALARAASRPALGVNSGGFDVTDDGAVRIFGSGGLRLISGDNVDIFSATGWTGAYTEPDGEPQPMTQMKRSDGTLAFFLGDPLPNVDGYQQYWAWYDRGGTLVLGDDTTSGIGLARPYGGATVTTDADNVTLTSTASFAETHSVALHAQNPRLAIAVSAIAPATGPGEVRVVHSGSGTVVAGPTAIPAGTNVAPFYIFSHPPSVDMFTQHYYSVQTRRVSGTGNVSNRLFFAGGYQS